MPEILPRPEKNPQEPSEEQNPLDDSYSAESMAKQYEEKYGTPQQIAQRKMEHEQQDREELEKLRESLEGKYEDKLTQEELETVKTDFEDLGESVYRLFLELNQRDEENFNPLIFHEDLKDLKKSADNLQSVIEQKEVNAVELGTAITYIMSAIDSMGNARQREEGVKDHGESLSAVSGALRSIFESSEDAIGKLKIIEKDEADSIKIGLKNLTESVQDKYGFVERKRAAFEEI